MLVISGIISIACYVRTTDTASCTQFRMRESCFYGATNALLRLDEKWTRGWLILALLIDGQARCGVSSAGGGGRLWERVRDVAATKLAVVEGETHLATFVP
jgi:hypothetical protein